VFQSDDSEDVPGMVFHGSKRLSRHEYSLRMYSSDVQVGRRFVTVVDHRSTSRTVMDDFRNMLNAVVLIITATRYATKPPGMQASIFGACPMATINWEGCVRKGIRHKNGGDSRSGGTN